MNIVDRNNIDFTLVESTESGWHYEWMAVYGTVRVVLWGIELGVTEDNEYFYDDALHNDFYIAPPLEVVPVGTMAISEQNLCHITLQWHRVSCTRYVVEYYNVDEWTPIASLLDDVNVSVQTYVTPLLENMDYSLFRVTAVDEDLRESDALPYNWFIVRPPAPPSGLEITCTNYILTVQ